MSNENSNNPDEVGLEEALNANNPEKERRFLIQQIDQIKDRLNNGLSEEVQRNTQFRQFVAKIGWILFPLMIGGIGTLLWFVIRNA